MRRRNTQLRGQTALNFMIIIGLATFIFIFAMALIFKLQVNLFSTQKIRLAEDLALSFQKEIQIAKESMPGYQRTFKVPQTIEGNPYTIRTVSCERYEGDSEQEGRLAGDPEHVQSGDSITITMIAGGKQTEVLRQVTAHRGTFIVGIENTIQNVNGEVILNKNFSTVEDRYNFNEICWCDRLNEQDCRIR